MVTVASTALIALSFVCYRDVHEVFRKLLACSLKHRPRLVRFRQQESDLPHDELFIGASQQSARNLVRKNLVPAGNIRCQQMLSAQKCHVVSQIGICIQRG